MAHQRRRNGHAPALAGKATARMCERKRGSLSGLLGPEAIVLLTKGVLARHTKPLHHHTAWALGATQHRRHAQLRSLQQQRQLLQQLHLLRAFQLVRQELEQLRAEALEKGHHLADRLPLCWRLLKRRQQRGCEMVACCGLLHRILPPHKLLGRRFDGCQERFCSRVRGGVSWRLRCGSVLRQ
jgi:hypothetical protein